MATLQDVADIVIAGKAKKTAGVVQDALDSGLDPKEILNTMIDAMSVVGDRFSRNEIFVPEMLVAAKAMKKGVDVLKPHLSDGSVGSISFSCWSQAQISFLQRGRFQASHPWWIFGLNRFRCIPPKSTLTF